MVDTQFSFDIVIRNITIEKLDGGGSLQIFPNPVELDEADPLFTNLVFGSSIYDPGMTGVLKFKEPGKVGDTFNFSGNEKVIISQEKIAPNMIQVYEIPKNNSRYGYISEVRSSSEKTFGITKTISVKITNKPNIYNNTLHISGLNISINICCFSFGISPSLRGPPEKVL